MTIAISRPNSIEDRSGIEAMMREYLSAELENLFRVSGRTVILDDLISATMSNLAAYLPPQGKTLLAHDANDALVGMIFLKFHQKDTAEIKRLYVRPAGRGTGLGRRLAEEILEEAKSLGAKRILLDTGVWLEPALALYRSLGFREVPLYPETENDPDLEEFLVYMELKV